MPELPEVEIASRSLGAQVKGATIVAVAKLDWEKMIQTPDPAVFRGLLVGRRIEMTGRRAKWILVGLDAGWTLAIHLRMSGKLLVATGEVEPDRHTHLVLDLHDGRRIHFRDERKFGRVRLLDPAGVAALSAEHGPEPLDFAFDATALLHQLTGRRTPIKQLLLDQQRIAGIGNIYASEALWVAAIHPLRPATTLSLAEATRLHEAIQVVLRQSIANQGSTLRDYRNSYGEAGRNQRHFHVYDRADQPCERCGAPIERIVQAQRSTYFCRQCQER